MPILWCGLNSPQLQKELIEIENFQWQNGCPPEIVGNGIPEDLQQIHLELYHYQVQAVPLLLLNQLMMMMIQGGYGVTVLS